MNTWYLDSCASSHLCANSESMSDISTDAQLKIKIANGQELLSKLKGNVNVNILSNDDVEEITISEVHYVPQISTNLLSVSQLTSKGYAVTFTKEGGKIIDRYGNLAATATQVNGIYRLDIGNNSPDSVFFVGKGNN